MLDILFKRTIWLVLIPFIVSLGIFFFQIYFSQVFAAGTTDTSYALNVVVIKYFPLTADGKNIDINVTGDVSEPYDQIKQKTVNITNNLVNLIPKSTKYLGYQNPNAPASLSINILDTKEYTQAVPTIIRSSSEPRYPNYNKIMSDHNICSLVDNQNVKEIWLFAYQGPNRADNYPSLGIFESKMAGPFGDISNSYRYNDLPKCNNTYRVYTYNYQRGTAEALHSWSHQMESEIDAVDATFFRNNFQGTNYPQTFGINGRCGSVHNPPNARFEYDWTNPMAQNSDCGTNWNPDGIGNLTSVSCANWGCANISDTDNAQLNYIIWNWQNLPGRGNTKTFQGKALRNFWDVHGNFDSVMGQDKSLFVSNPSPLPSVEVTQTITFDDISGQDQLLKGQYPVQVIDWGNTNNWIHSSPWELFNTKSVSYNGSSITSASFNFINSKKLISLKAYNGGSGSSTITLICPGNTTKTQLIASKSVTSIITGWNTPCTSVTLESSNGWFTNFDDLVIAGSSVNPSISPTPSVTPLPTPSVSPSPILSPSPSATVNPSTLPQQTITFDNISGQDQVLKGQYPSQIIDWGNTNDWFHSSPWNLFTTKSISYNNASITQASFTFLNPVRLVSIKAYNGGEVATIITITCSGNLTKVQSIPSKSITVISTGWINNCSVVNLQSSNGWNTNFDDLVIEGSAPGNSPTPTVSPVPSVIPSPTINPSSQPSVQTIAFDNASGQDIVLKGEYPIQVIDWGSSSNWLLSSPWNLFTTKSLSFYSGNITSASFNFVKPKILVSLEAYNGGNSNTTVTLSCLNNPVKTFNVTKNSISQIVTGWLNACTSVTIQSSNGWETNFDNLKIK